LAPTISFAPWLPEEDCLIIQKVNEIGTKWATIAKFTVGRTGNALKNHWYSGLRNMCSCDAAGKWALNCPPAEHGQLQPHDGRQANQEMAISSWEQFIIDGEAGLAEWY
jgi:hypothetical protein